MYLSTIEIHQKRLFSSHYFFTILVFGIVSFLGGMIAHSALPTKTNWAQTFRSAAVGCLSAKLTYSVTACILTKKFLLFTKYDYKIFVYSSYCHGAKLFLCFRFWTRFWTWSHQRMVFGKFFSNFSLCKADSFEKILRIFSRIFFLKIKRKSLLKYFVRKFWWFKDKMIAWHFDKIFLVNKIFTCILQW